MSVTYRMQDGDYFIDPTGGQEVISRATKAAQDLLEELFLPYEATTDRGNEMFTSDGGFLPVIGNPDLGAQTIESMLRTTVQRFMRRQASSNLTDNTEVIQRIERLIVRPIPGQELSYFFLLVIVINDSQIALQREILLRHLGSTPLPLVGGFDH